MHTHINSYLYMLVFLVIIIPFNNIYHLRRQGRLVHEGKNNVTSKGPSNIAQLVIA